jgi:hypothetical protein
VVSTGSRLETQQASPAEKSQHGWSPQSWIDPAQQAWAPTCGHQPSLVQISLKIPPHTPLQHSSPRTQHSAPHSSSTIGQQASFETQTPLGHGFSVDGQQFCSWMQPPPHCFSPGQQLSWSMQIRPQLVIRSGHSHRHVLWLRVMTSGHLDTQRPPQRAVHGVRLLPFFLRRFAFPALAAGGRAAMRPPVRAQRESPRAASRYRSNHVVEGMAFHRVLRRIGRRGIAYPPRRPVRAPR